MTYLIARSMRALANCGVLRVPADNHVFLALYDAEEIETRLTAAKQERGA